MLKDVINSTSITIDMGNQRVNVADSTGKIQESRYLTLDPPVGCEGTCWRKLVSECPLLSAETVVEASEGRIKDKLEDLRERLKEATCTPFDMERFKKMYYPPKS